MSRKKLRIAVTGAHGKIGTTLVPYLQDQGHTVFLIDQDEPASEEELYMRADITDFGQALDALSSKGEDVYARPDMQAFDVVVHLASMPHPRMIPDSDEFRTNMLATFNVFEACRRLGIKNVVWTSSEVATGVPYDKTDPPYVPVDEQFPMRGYNVYSLTKVLGEEMAKQFCLNDSSLRITCLRLSNVMNPSQYPDFLTWQDDPSKRAWNMWTYVDNRDVAQAIELALHHQPRGCEPFFITNDDTVMRADTSELLEHHYRDVPRRKQFQGNEVVLTNEKAKRVLGFAPKHSWRDHV